ncbi:MAG: 30S ribosomal protein S2 [Candidatus Aenigmarchaeota archaeon]|nr:30S ribosomal protein S2 [Candidatus Aenigmarchaeota archaeon]
MKKLLLTREKYLSAGVHIGMTSKTSDMKRFIYKVRPNGMAVLNVGLLDRRIAYAASMIAPKKSILIVSKKDNCNDAVTKFAETTGSRAIIGRFMPGSLTNPTFGNFFEPEIVIVTDPFMDKQVIREAIQMRIPIIGFAGTYNETSYLDLVLPCNNKGKKSMALILWLLAKLVAEKRGQSFSATPEDFGYAE